MPPRFPVGEVRKAKLLLWRPRQRPRRQSCCAVPFRTNQGRDLPDFANFRPLLRHTNQ